MRQPGRSGQAATWLVSAGRFKVIDGLRKHSRLDTVLPDLALEADTADPTLTEAWKWGTPVWASTEKGRVGAWEG